MGMNVGEKGIAMEPMRSLKVPLIVHPDIKFEELRRSFKHTTSGNHKVGAELGAMITNVPLHS